MADRTTPEPGERSFEDLLASPLEQFGLPPELLASIMAYSTAPSGTVGAQPLQPAARLVCLPAAEVERLRAELAEARQVIAALPDPSTAKELREKITELLGSPDEALVDAFLGYAWSETARIAGGEMTARWQAEDERDRLKRGGKELGKVVRSPDVTDCRNPEGVTVGLIDGIITAARVLRSRDLTHRAVIEALRDIADDEDVRALLAAPGAQEARNPADSPSGELPGPLPPATADGASDSTPEGNRWSCPRCGSVEWVAASLTGPVEYGGRAIKQCIPCGHYSNDPVKPETTPDGGEENDG